MPIKTITEWLAKEKKAGSENPARAILATVTANGIPHSRVVAVREVKPEGIVFFTQSAFITIAYEPPFGLYLLTSTALWVPNYWKQL